MTDIYAALSTIAKERAADPLKPITVITPSHAAALQLRRHLATLTPFAAVRFETLPRIAELVAGGHMAAAGRVPLARPIGDYLAEQVALESGPAMAAVRDLPGYARVLRQMFGRLRRAGITARGDVPVAVPGTHLDSVLDLYERFRQESSAFYDVEDLLDAAANAVGQGIATDALADLGACYVVPPGPLTAASAGFVEALSGAGLMVTRLEDPVTKPAQRFRVSPDPATEVAEGARQVIRDLEGGATVGDVAVFHGSGTGYPAMLREALARAQVPAAPLPGRPLIETRAGRGVLLLASLPDRDYSRTAVMDFLTVAPLATTVPGRDGPVRLREANWDRASRDAGVTHGLETWQTRLQQAAEAATNQADALEGQGPEYESRARMLRYLAEHAEELSGVISKLAERLEKLRPDQPAGDFISAFRSIVSEYLGSGAESLDLVLDEIDQLGAVGAVGGTFSLSSFQHALRANLEVAFHRPAKLGEGVVLAHYDIAAGLRFRHVYLCGAYEGAFPAAPAVDSILDDRVWRALRQQFPHMEDTQARIDRAKSAVARAAAAAGNGVVTWSCPSYEAGGGRDFYPSPALVEALNADSPERLSAAGIRSGALPYGLPIHRSSSPISSSVTGAVLDLPELGMRSAVLTAQAMADVGRGHPRARAVAMLRARWSASFTEWDGHIGPGIVTLTGKAGSPTRLEEYAKCGYRYFGKYVLNLRSLNQPEQTEVMSPLDRGGLIHEVLERFFKAKQAEGRPAPGEAWNEQDAAELFLMANQAITRLQGQGKAGLAVYSEHDRRTIMADLERFLEEDTAFRLGNGAVPAEFEGEIPEVSIGGVTMRGRFDRLDRSIDGRRAWIIDYKTGKDTEFQGFDKDIFLRGNKLQLAAYAHGVPAEHVTALYWLISDRGKFQKFETGIGSDEREKLERIIRAIARGVDEGVFPPVSGAFNDHFESYENCGYCDLNRVCDMRRAAAFDRKAGDQAMAVWGMVGEA